MNLDEKITQVRALISQRDELDKQIAALLGDKVLSLPPTRQRKSSKPKRGKNLQQEIESEHRTTRRHPETERIEGLLIEGFATPAIMEQVTVSAPTVSVIRARLRQEGRLA